MIFQGINEQSVEFRIVGYEFPEITTPDDYDSNWLNIYLNVKSKQGHWVTVDPSLLTSDIEELIKWFVDLAENKTVHYISQEFIEPNLSFHLLENETDLKTIRIKFDFESRPQSAEDDIMYYVDCLFYNNELRQIADELSNELLKFPAR